MKLLTEKTKHSKKHNWAVTRILSDAESSAEALPLILAKIREKLNWQFGAFWLVNAKDDSIKLKHDWFDQSSKGLAEFAQVSRSMSFTKGFGMPRREQARSKKLILNVDVASPIQTIKTDAARPRQILINVYAIKFIQEGGIDVTISSTPGAGKNNKDMIFFVIRDTGPGLTSEQSKRLFQPFIQGDRSTSRKFGGTGLGQAPTAESLN